MIEKLRNPVIGIIGEKGMKKNKPGKNDIALLGPRNTFSDIAADRYLSSFPLSALPLSALPLSARDNGKTSHNMRINKFYAKSLEEVFELVENEKVAKGIVPIENKLEGSVRETLDLLFLKNVKIVDLINLPIHHCLAMLPFASKKDIKKILSHEQALNQCKRFLKNNFPKIDLEPYSSTSASIEKLIFSKDKTLAVIASQEAIKLNNLKIFAKNIEDDHTNTTKFVIIEKGEFKTFDNEQKNRTKKVTSIAFHFDKDSPGSLFEVFKEFAQAKINLTKIESRPTKKEFGDYIFYLDFDGSPNDQKIKAVLNKISKKVAKLKILGSF